MTPVVNNVGCCILSFFLFGEEAFGSSLVKVVGTGFGYQFKWCEPQINRVLFWS